MTADEPIDGDPATLAAEAAALVGPTLFAFDIDGVLAPIATRPDEASLSPGVLASLKQLAARDPVAVVSGRALADVEGFGFPDMFLAAGSHGAERRSRVLTPLDPAERDRLTDITTLAERAAETAGTGAWVEHKPTGVVLHVRSADPLLGNTAIQALEQWVARVAGTHAKRGHMVLELAARPASKALAVAEMRTETGAASVCYVGDDVTDEDVFADLDPRNDLAIRVGPGPTRAWRRLTDPAAVATFLAALTPRCTSPL